MFSNTERQIQLEVQVCHELITALLTISDINNMEEKKSHNKNIILEIWDFLKVRKKWWLLPIIIMMLLAGLLIVFGASSGLSPFLYALG